MQWQPADHAHHAVPVAVQHPCTPTLTTPTRHRPAHQYHRLVSYVHWSHISVTDSLTDKLVKFMIVIDNIINITIVLVGIKHQSPG